MDDTIVTELRAHIARLEHRIAELEAVPEVSPPPTAGQEPAPSRRNLFRLAAVGVGGAAAGVVGMPSTAAACDIPVYAGCPNTVSSTTSLHAQHTLDPVLAATNGATGGTYGTLGGPNYGIDAWAKTGTALLASTDSGPAAIRATRKATATTPDETAAVIGEHKNTDSSGTGVIGKHSGAGWGVWARSVSGKGLHADGGTGTGAEGTTTGSVAGTYGLIGRLTATTPAANTAAVLGTTPKGIAIQGSGGTGRGGVFSGAAAQIRLNAGSKATHPIAGVRGDLYVDNTGRLWFCKVTGNPATWTQVV